MLRVRIRKNFICDADELKKRQKMCGSYINPTTFPCARSKWETGKQRLTPHPPEEVSGLIIDTKSHKSQIIANEIYIHPGTKCYQQRCCKNKKQRNRN